MGSSNKDKGSGSIRDSGMVKESKSMTGTAGAGGSNTTDANKQDKAQNVKDRFFNKVNFNLDQNQGLQVKKGVDPTMANKMLADTLAGNFASLNALEREEAERQGLIGQAKLGNATDQNLQRIADLNNQFGYNPTQGMGIMNSLKFNTFGMGEDIQNLMNNPILKLAGLATNPLATVGGLFANNLYSNLTDEDDQTGFLSSVMDTTQNFTPFDISNLKTDFTNTANALSQFQQAPNLSTGFSGLYNNFLNSLNTEEETYDGPFPVQKPKNFTNFVEDANNPNIPNQFFDDALDTEYNYDIRDFLSDAEDTYGVDVTENLYSDSTIEKRIPGIFDTAETTSTTPGINIAPKLGDVFTPNVLTYGGGLPVTYGTSDDDIMQGGYVGYSGTGPYSVDFDTMGQPFNRPTIDDLRQGKNQGGLIPPMSGPMSGGVGNLFKMK